MAQPCIIIAGGGTGGHVLPGLAVARELRDNFGAEVRFIGTARGMETRLVPAAGFPLELIASGPLNRVSFAQRLKSLWAIPQGVAQSKHLLRKYGARAVLSVGGYAAGPAMLAAKLRGVSSVVFEPNAVPGITNRIAGRWARIAAVNFAEAGRYFTRSEVTGIPVRAEFFSVPAESAFQRPHLLVFGGSQGARIFNHALPQIMPELMSRVSGLTVLHQAGASRAAEVEDAYRSAGISEDRVRVAEFVTDMAGEFARACLVMARSGASTVAELGAAGRPALLVPFAAAADDHQRKNAESFARDGAACVLLEASFTPERLLQKLAALLGDSAQLARMASAAKRQSRPDAARRIAELVMESAR